METNHWRCWYAARATGILRLMLKSWLLNLQKRKRPLELRTIMRAKNVYRSHVVSLSIVQHGTTEVRFHRLPAIAGEDIILPQGVWRV